MLDLFQMGRYGVRMEHINREVGARVAAIIEAKGVTQRAVAEATGIPLASFNRRVRGFVAFDTNQIFRIADALSVSVTDFFPERNAA